MTMRIQFPYHLVREQLGHRATRNALFRLPVMMGLLIAPISDALAQARPAWERSEAIRTLLDGATPIANAVKLDLPAVTQDGSSVLVTAEVARPMMTADSHVEALYLFALGNPSPELMEVSWTPLVGKAVLTTRIRLDSSQTVLALARTSDGEWLAGSHDVRVTVSGCLSRESTYRSDDHMRTRVRVPPRVNKGEAAEVATLINHPMETGLRTDAQGNPIPEQILRTFEARLGEDEVMTIRLHRAVAANPYILFHIAPLTSGELTLTWTADSGETAVSKSSLQVD